MGRRNLSCKILISSQTSYLTQSNSIFFVCVCVVCCCCCCFSSLFYHKLTICARINVWCKQQQHHPTTTTIFYATLFLCFSITMSSRVSLQSKSTCVCFLYILWRKVLFHIIEKHYSVLSKCFTYLCDILSCFFLFFMLFFQFILPWIIHFEKRILWYESKQSTNIYLNVRFFFSSQSIQLSNQLYGEHRCQIE